MSGLLRAVVTSGLGLALASCSGTGVQSALDPQGPQASRIADLWWVLLVICVVVFVAVVTALAIALAPRRNRVVDDVSPTREAAARRTIGVAVVLTVVILLGLVGYSAAVGRAISTFPMAADRPITIDIIGHQWWWEVRYVDGEAYRTFTTANELRLPVGRPAIIRGMSRDVIHSFWVPNLHGKVDFIPGRITTLWLQADAAGEWRGQCAEFCGLQHAKMSLDVIAESPDEFEAWREASWSRGRVPPADDLTARGEAVFVSAQCAMCHTVRGTSARATAGPDLTRIGSRTSLAAGSVPNTRGHLAAWILDPQQIKPGSFMPPTPLAAYDLQALLAYLESLR